ncbi:hypothetical protein [Polynucleobacter sp. AP-RePozz3-80-G7]|uniref:hypothetical protein n=1 Tax=Polynucleobacter sp. AP-RePozz3-80-G7 TaxID=2689105 RepID=UPI001C0CA86B|nr:hypothetical protein [Polynucleobacter sp. AP-RePozz3-80-G7]MBU3639756.1 hypothetical protein [Polynucleobacter sp. AP-RePozz3-80-G7]
MKINRFKVATFFFFQVIRAASANDEIGDVDKARVFPVQKNNTVIHSASKNEGDTNESQALSFSTPASKTQTKDTSLIINGNGGSTNRAAGGNAALRKRFTFD